MGNKIELKSIKELLEMKFFIPSYQRGYRWTKQQVCDLLNDINEFIPEKSNNSDESTWYCLQPLVIKEIKESNGTHYNVIDGQQRLTTIFILLNYLDANNQLSLEYQTRAGSSDFLKQISQKDNKSDTNIDYHFMLEAKNALVEWQNGKSAVEISNFITKLKEHCKVIWYPIAESESDYEVFKRLNSGKLSLSNAELIKALLLNKENFSGSEDSVYLKQLEMAGEWDRIEQTLHDDSFWYFINPEPNSSKYKSTRIDFVFEMALRCRKDNNGYLYNDIDEELKKDRYFVFTTFYKQCSKDTNSSLNIWREIVSIFRTMNSWYNDRQLYHYIGYLMNQKGANKLETLRDILVLQKETPKSKFIENVKERCASSILEEEEIEENGQKKKIWQRNLETLSYFDNNRRRNSKDCDIMHNILLLFNLATIQNQISENSRYPFDRHVNEKWSLEHIHAKNEKRENISSERIKEIVHFLETSGNGDLANLIWHNRATVPLEISYDSTEYDAITKAFEGNIIKLDNKGCIDKDELNLIDDEWYQTSIRNMALLQGNKNSQFNNSYYHEKKELLSKYEGNNKQDTKIEFVPICTRNAFFKHYSQNSNNPLCWDADDGKNMLEAMVKNIAQYVGLKEYGELKDITEKDRHYGLTK